MTLMFAHPLGREVGRDAREGADRADGGREGGLRQREEGEEEEGEEGEGAQGEEAQGAQLHRHHVGRPQPRQPRRGLHQRRDRRE